jgi:hypothetical protein
MFHDFRQHNREPATWAQVLNPIWWASDVERNHNWTWYKWFFRNPFCNFFMVIVGIADYDRDCFWSVSPWTYADRGFNYGYSIPVHCWKIPFPFISYRGTWIEWAIGWKTSGGFTMTLRKSNSCNAKDIP